MARIDVDDATVGPWEPTTPEQEAERLRLILGTVGALDYAADRTWNENGWDEYWLKVWETLNRNTRRDVA